MRCYIVPWIGGGKSYFTEAELPNVIGPDKAKLLTSEFPAMYCVGRSECDFYYVSTTFLGHSFNGCEPPTPFESMAFMKENGEINFMDIDRMQATTWENAENNHRVLVERYLTKLPDDWPKLEWWRMD